jgi:hypothetical protein
MLLDVSKVIPSDTYLTNFHRPSRADRRGRVDVVLEHQHDDHDVRRHDVVLGETLHFASLSTWLNRLESVQAGPTRGPRTSPPTRRSPVRTSSTQRSTSPRTP